jgi:hypothetical protein
VHVIVNAEWPTDRNAVDQERSLCLVVVQRLRAVIGLDRIRIVIRPGFNDKMVGVTTQAPSGPLSLQ